MYTNTVYTILCIKNTNFHHFEVFTKNAPHWGALHPTILYILQFVYYTVYIILCILYSVYYTVYYMCHHILITPHSDGRIESKRHGMMHQQIAL